MIDPEDPDGPEYPRPESGNLWPTTPAGRALVYGGCLAIVLAGIAIVLILVMRP